MVRGIARSCLFLVLLVFPAGGVVQFASATAASNGGSWACAAPDPSSGCSNLIASLPTPRQYPAVAAGTDGMVYAFGGESSSAADLAAAERYSPTTGTWSSLAGMPTARREAGAAAGTDGRLYVIGGAAAAVPLSAVEVYDPAAPGWQCSTGDTGAGCMPGTPAIAPLPTARICPGVAAGTDGTIYAVAGIGAHYSQETDAYDPTTGQWTQKAPVPVQYVTCVVAAQAGGKIYVLGSTYDSGTGSNVSTFEVYNPTSDAWAGLTPFPDTRQDMMMAAGPDNRLYVFGGHPEGSDISVDSAYCYDPTLNTWTQIPNMSLRRGYGGAALDSDGRIYLVAGEILPSPSSQLTFSSVETFDPTTQRYNDTPIPGSSHQADVLRATVVPRPDGTVYVFNGFDSTMERFSPATNDWTDMAPLGGSGNSDSMAALGADGRIYDFGHGAGPSSGQLTTTPSAFIAAYDIAANAWTCSVGDTDGGCATFTLPSMPTARSAGAAVADPTTGLIYVIGGNVPDAGSTAPSGVIEAYDPVTHTWICSHADSGSGCTSSSIPPMPTPRQEMAAALGNDGKIYVMGGRGAAGTTAVVEAYNPITNQWTCSVGDAGAGCTPSNSTIPSLPTARSRLAVATAPDGAIYAFGGLPASQKSPGLDVVESYTPGASGWICSAGDSGTGCGVASSTLTPRPSANAFLAAATLPDGRIETVGSDQSLWTEVEMYTPPSSVTSARVSNFHVSRRGASLIVRWSTRAEGVAGFNLYAGGERLNHRLISTHAERCYTYTTHHGRTGTIRLQIVLLSGEQEVSATSH